MRSIDADAIEYKESIIDITYRSTDGVLVWQEKRKLEWVSKEDIDKMPTIEAEPIRHGHWIKGEKIYPDMLNDSTYGYWCSECHNIDVHGDNVEVLYCWHCGAKMDEVNDEVKDT